MLVIGVAKGVGHPVSQEVVITDTPKGLLAACCVRLTMRVSQTNA